jgi:DNA-binding transcriptional MerR regulator
MARLTITDAARVTGVSRVTLHRYIKAGKLSRSADGTIDTAELLRIGLVLHPDTVLQPVTMQRDGTPSATPTVTPPDAATLQQLIAVLQRELNAAHTREEAAREREATLLQMVQQLQQQHQRLLDMPHPPLVPRPLGTTEMKGAIRRRIVELLRDYPEGLSGQQTREFLAVEKDLRPTMKAMVRDGLIRRVGKGLYGV